MPTAPSTVLSRRSLIGAAAAALLIVTVPVGFLLGRGGQQPPPTATRAGARQELVYEVELGPYPDQASATVVQQAVGKQWPNVWVTLEGGHSFVHVLRTVYIDKAERLVERFKQQGYRARVRPSTRDYLP